MIEVFKEKMNTSLKEIEENAIKWVEAFKEEINKWLKIDESTIKQVKETKLFKT